MNKHIPDEAIKKESLSSIFKDIFENNSARKEQKAFEEENYGDGIPKAVNGAIKRFVSWISVFSIILLGFFTLIFICLITNYTKFIINDQELLTSFLADFYRVFSGAAIVLFFQLLISVLNKKQTNK